MLLKRLKAKERKVVRTQKVVKISQEKLPAANAAATKIQSWVRMLAVWLPARRLRCSLVDACLNRAQLGSFYTPEEIQRHAVQRQLPAEEIARNTVLRQLPFHQSALKLSKDVKTAQFQAAALRLQSYVRARRQRTKIIRIRSAAAVLTSSVHRTLLQLEWKTKFAEITLQKVYERSLCQLAFQEQKASISVLQAICRRSVKEIVSEQKRKVHQATFKRAYINHKMWMMREIWTRRDAIVEIQSQIRYCRIWLPDAPKIVPCLSPRIILNAPALHFIPETDLHASDIACCCQEDTCKRSVLQKDYDGTRCQQCATHPTRVCNSFNYQVSNGA